MATDTGADSVTASAEPAGVDVYCGYADGTFANITAVMDEHPGKLYLSITPRLETTSPADCLDIETGDAVPADAPEFVRTWKKFNTNRPVLYASLSVMPDIMNALTAAGIARDRYYLWVADWNGVAVIPTGYDAIQYKSGTEFDSDIFSAYMWGNSALPVPSNMRSSFYIPAVQLWAGWSEVPTAKSYHVQIEELRETGWFLAEDFTTPKFGFQSENFPQKTHIRWRVSALPGGTWSEWIMVITP